MNVSELIAEKMPEIKKLLFSKEEETTEVLEFVDAKLTDGTIVKVTPAMEVGAKVSVISEDGSEVEAPDGEHELEEGTIIRTEGGVIVEILEPEAAEEEEEVEEEAKDEEEEDMYEKETPAFDAEAFKNDILTSVAEMLEKSSFAKSDKLNEVVEAVGLVTDIVERLADTPKEQPTKKVDSPFRKQKDYSTVAESMARALREIKK